MITDELHDNSLTCWRVQCARRALTHSGIKWLKPTKNKFPLMWFNDFLQKKVSADSHYFHFRSFRALRIQKLSNCCRQSISRILLYFLAGFWLYGPTLYRPAADFVGAGGGFSSLVVRSFQLFHPLVGKQLSSAICQSANRGQIRGLLSWCCCSVRGRSQTTFTRRGR